eukprot:gi/632978148/ref/XP_007905745.1/ PREDICTED: nitric oxide-associated protein 1 [Callorhinchus milii]
MTGSWERSSGSKVSSEGDQCACARAAVAAGRKVAAMLSVRSRRPMELLLRATLGLSRRLTLPPRLLLRPPPRCRPRGQARAQPGHGPRSAPVAESRPRADGGGRRGGARGPGCRGGEAREEGSEAGAQGRRPPRPRQQQVQRPHVSPGPQSPLSHLPSSSKRRASGRHPIYGSPDPLEPISSCNCSGCGAVLHCTEPSQAGYLPSEKYKRLVQEGALDKSVCQRCFLLVHHHRALDVKVSVEQYREIVSGIRKEKALVLYMIDLLDLPGTIIPDLLDLVGEQKSVLILANKVDLIPSDSRNYLKRIQQHVFDLCVRHGIYDGQNIKDVQLISAKTGYGIEHLISKLQSSWKRKGDVYLVGTTNVGKSTLFNTLLKSDYCKSKTPDVIQRATISRWPGTTLNLLKFPIINPTPSRMEKRAKRLKADKSQTEFDLDEEELKQLHRLKKHGYLIGRIGKTFHNSQVIQQRNKVSEQMEWDPDQLAISMEDDHPQNRLNIQENLAFTYNELKDARWFYDTPGIVKEDCVLNLLTEHELKVVMPSSGIVPRTFVLQPGMVLLLGALGRIDFLKGEKSAWFSVLASNQLPVHITSLEKADSIYQKHAGKAFLGVPIGGEERMKDFPSLVPQNIELEGIGLLEAAADIKLSSAGWIAVTAHSEDKIELRAYTPAAIGLLVQKPPLLPFIVQVKGERIRKTPAYKLKKPIVQSLSLK